MSIKGWAQRKVYNDAYYQWGEKLIGKFQRILSKDEDQELASQFDSILKAHKLQLVRRIEKAFAGNFADNAIHPNVKKFIKDYPTLREAHTSAKIHKIIQKRFPLLRNSRIQFTPMQIKQLQSDPPPAKRRRIDLENNNSPGGASINSPTLQSRVTSQSADLAPLLTEPRRRKCFSNGATTSPSQALHSRAIGIQEQDAPNVHFIPAREMPQLPRHSHTSGMVAPIQSAQNNFSIPKPLERRPDIHFTNYVIEHFSEQPLIPTKEMPQLPRHSHADAMVAPSQSAQNNFSIPIPIARRPGTDCSSEQFSKYVIEHFSKQPRIW